MDDAVRKVRQLAASALARKERLEEELGALQADRQTHESARDLAIAEGDDTTALRLTQLLQALGERFDSKRGEVSAAEGDYRAILEDLRTVQDAAEEHRRLIQRAPLDAARASDPFAVSAEDAALENVRHHIEELSARAELEDELGSSLRKDAELARSISKAEAEAKARAELEELKAKRKSAPAAKKPKKTM